MSAPETRRWLADLQQRFTQVLRLPLERNTLVLRAEIERYPEATLADLSAGPHSSASERIAVYHRQYWFRLFGVMQHEFRLTARLLGLWTFNDYASRFLERHPPRHYDIHLVADGFTEFLASELQSAELELPGKTSVPRQALLEASRIDQAYREVLSAPLQPPFAFSQQHAASLPLSRLTPAPTWRLTSESWALMALRKQLADDTGEHAVALPERHTEEQHWVIFSNARGHAVLPLMPVQARLLAALREHTVGHALASVEQGANEAERAQLLAHAQAWLAESVQRGFWVDLKQDLA